MSRKCRVGKRFMVTHYYVGHHADKVVVNNLTSLDNRKIYYYTNEVMGFK